MARPAMSTISARSNPGASRLPAAGVDDKRQSASPILSVPDQRGSGATACSSVSCSHDVEEADALAPRDCATSDPSEA